MIKIGVVFLISVFPASASKVKGMEFYHEFGKVAYSDPYVMDAKSVFYKVNRTQGAMNVTVNTKRTYDYIPVSKIQFPR